MLKDFPPPGRSHFHAFSDNSQNMLMAAAAAAQYCMPGGLDSGVLAVISITPGGTLQRRQLPWQFRV